jgi:uridine kinase
MGKNVAHYMKNIIYNPLFILGIFIRFALILLIIPLAVSDWYAPFLNVSTSQFFLDPWSAWLNAGGTPVAFPYGYAMWLAFLPLTMLAKLLSIPLLYAYDLTIFAADLALLVVLRSLIPNRDRLLLSVYWLSPIVLLASYVYGLNDLIPVFLLAVAFYFTKQTKLRFAGIALLAAISAKLSMVLALPFFLIYFFHNRPLRQLMGEFLVGLLIGSAILILPFIMSGGSLHMLFSNPEMGKVFRVAINLGGNIFIYVVPLIYLVMLYLVWRVRRINYNLFHATMGMAFLLIVLLTSSSPGWFIWSIPVLVVYQATSGRIAIILVGIFSSLYVLSSLLAMPINIAGMGVINLDSYLHLSERLGHTSISLLQTILLATGVVLCLRIWRETIIRNDFFRLSRKPFVIGVAGDSGAGKDTFSEAIQGLFGAHSVTALSGDDYHLWDRQKPIWQVITPLNPKANDLESFSNDLVALTDGKPIHAHNYDHRSGKMTIPFQKKSNDFIIASGLHALYLPILRDCYNLSIYLEIDEELRKYFKIKRDVNQRGHALEQVTASLERREPDAERFIRPQAAYADLVLSLQPIHPRILTNINDERPLRLKLSARTRYGLNETSLIRVLVGICGLHVDMAVNNDGSEVVLTIEGDTSVEDIAMAAQMLCPRVLEFLDTQPKWQDGVMGLMQLITLSHISQALTKRFI